MTSCSETGQEACHTKPSADASAPAVAHLISDPSMSLAEDEGMKNEDEGMKNAVVGRSQIRPS